MNEIEIETLIDWLGPDGAIAGLEASSLTVSELCDLARRRGGNADKKMKRIEIINELVNCKSKKIDKEIDEILLMNTEEIQKYFQEIKISRSEILELLFRFEIVVGSEDKKKLQDFAARELRVRPETLCRITLVSG